MQHIHAQHCVRQKLLNSKTTTANAIRECKLNSKLFRFAQFPQWFFLLCTYAAKCECNQWTVENVVFHFHSMNCIAFSLNQITLISRAIALIAFTIERSFGRPEEIQTNWTCSIFMILLPTDSLVWYDQDVCFLIGNLDNRIEHTSPRVPCTYSALSHRGRGHCS